MRLSCFIVYPKTLKKIKLVEKLDSRGILVSFMGGMRYPNAKGYRRGWIRGGCMKGKGKNKRFPLFFLLFFSPPNPVILQKSRAETAWNFSKFFLGI